jgi:hypothetical protein
MIRFIRQSKPSTVSSVLSIYQLIPIERYANTIILQIPYVFIIL